MKERRVLFITGAASGIGQLAARRALESGWAVAAVDLNTDGLNALGDGPHLLKLPVDVTDFDAVTEAVAMTEQALGSPDRVTHAAAIMPLGLLMQQRAQLIHKIMAINYGGLVNVTFATLPSMLKRGRGDFISFASMAGHVPTIYMGAYDASKFAVVAFTEVLHHENRGSGVRFACVCPPVVATPLLQQAKESVWPKMFDASPPLSPQEVLDALERSLDMREFWVFPGRGTKLSWRLRRFLPDVLWRRVHDVEGI